MVWLIPHTHSLCALWVLRAYFHPVRLLRCCGVSGRLCYRTPGLAMACHITHPIQFPLGLFNLVNSRQPNQHFGCSCPFSQGQRVKLHEIIHFLLSWFKSHRPWKQKLGMFNIERAFVAASPKSHILVTLVHKENEVRWQSGGITKQCSSKPCFHWVLGVSVLGFPPSTIYTWDREGSTHLDGMCITRHGVSVSGVKSRASSQLFQPHSILGPS